MAKNRMRPIHPGEILRDELDEAKLSARAVAAALGVPTNRVTAILNQRRGITADTALRLARFFGTTPELWLNLQTAYDLKVTSREVGSQILHNVKPRHAA